MYPGIIFLFPFIRRVVASSHLVSWDVISKYVKLHWNMHFFWAPQNNCDTPTTWDCLVPFRKLFSISVLLSECWDNYSIYLDSLFTKCITICPSKDLQEHFHIGFKFSVLSCEISYIIIIIIKLYKNIFSIILRFVSTVL